MTVRIVASAFAMVIGVVLMLIALKANTPSEFIIVGTSLLISGFRNLTEKQEPRSFKDVSPHDAVADDSY